MRATSCSRHRRSIVAVGFTTTSAVLLAACGGVSSGTSATSEAPTIMPVSLLTGSTFTCPSNSGYVTDIATSKDAQGRGHTAIFLGYCGTDVQKLETNPAVTVLDAAGKPLQVAVKHEPVSPDDSKTIEHNTPACMFLDWQGPRTSSGVKGSRVEVAPASGRAAFALDLQIEFDAKPTLTVSQWTGASGTASSCVGSG